jgi:choline dehydrogenase
VRRCDAQLAEFLRGTAETEYHRVGTCRTGTDGEAVVDAALNVHGRSMRLSCRRW